jgi:hypothetical protein
MVWNFYFLLPATQLKDHPLSPLIPTYLMVDFQILNLRTRHVVMTRDRINVKEVCLLASLVNNETTHHLRGII